MAAVDELYQQLLLPSAELIADLKRVDGDILILGAGGKMGPDLTRLTKKATTGQGKKVMAASRFSEKGLQESLEREGIDTFKVDLLQEEGLRSLPDVKNIIYLAGTKFGTSGNESLTWAMNAYLPGRVAEKYKQSRIVVFSTGNVYPLTTVSSGGAGEKLLPQPIGEYAQSCLGRERVFQYFSSSYNTPMLIFRLNYANDVSYGVLVDIALAVKNKQPVDLTMGYVNVIWQREANERALRSLLHCSAPPKILNVTGPLVAVRDIAGEFGKIFGQEPVFVNKEQPTALLSDPAESMRLFGELRVSLKTMIEVIAAWIDKGGRLLNKPTHFQEREGQF